MNKKFVYIMMTFMGMSMFLSVLTSFLKPPLILSALLWAGFGLCLGGVLGLVEIKNTRKPKDQ